MSKSGRQTTLFQTWGYEGNEDRNNDSVFPDEDDEDLIRALELSRQDFEAKTPTGPSPSTSVLPKSPTFPRSKPSTSGCRRQAELVSTSSGLSISLNKKSSPSLSPKLQTRSIRHSLSELPGFDTHAGRKWVYPTNYPKREYQFNIVKSCLFANTLVVLPTGLGKTFIAAVVMYNFFRWYPDSKLVFMAPTKPLVAQQIEACFKIMGIPQEETMEMTGNVAVKKREIAWQDKRVFFLTPQVMSNDLGRNLFPAKDVKLLVVDEAHRAQGDYAYCQVVRELEKSGTKYRVLALSATPGKDVGAVNDVIRNLKISHIELRQEDSPDITPYTFERHIEKIVVPLGQELNEIKAKFLEILGYFVNNLANARALPSRSNSKDPNNYSHYTMFTAWNEFRQNPPMGISKEVQGRVDGDFASAITLYHGYQRLTQHGMRNFYKFLTDKLNDEKKSWRLKAFMKKSEAWQYISEKLGTKFQSDMNNSRLNMSRPELLAQGGLFFSHTDEESENLVSGHPKLDKLREIVLKHFREKMNQHKETRVMIFSENRNSVNEICACLHKHRSIVKVMEFVGQAGAKGKKGLTQKEQIEVVRRFREGNYNTLVSTCVGEEGLDIGEVDLIICYDVSKSPIRLVQRMGRTGRKREGKIVVLVSEGKEDSMYQQSMYSKNAVNKAILDGRRIEPSFVPSPRLIPDGFEPELLEMHMLDRKFDHQAKNEPTKKKAAPKTAEKRKERVVKKTKKPGPENNRRISGMLQRCESESPAPAPLPEPVKDAENEGAIDQNDELSDSDLLFMADQISTQDVEGVQKNPKLGGEVSLNPDSENGPGNGFPSWLCEPSQNGTCSPIKSPPSLELLSQVKKLNPHAIREFDFESVFAAELGVAFILESNMDLLDGSPIRTHLKNFKTSTPTACGKPFLGLTPPRTTASPTMPDEDLEAIFADSAFEIKQSEDETKSQGFTATQLASLLANREASTSHAAKSVDSMADMFDSDDDDFFRDIKEESLKAKANESTSTSSASRHKFVFKPLNKSEPEASPSPVAKGPRRKLVLLDDSDRCDDDDTEASVSGSLPRPSSRRQRSKKSKFVLSQAEASSDDFDHSNEDHLDNVNLDEFEESFVDDGTQRDQVDMRAHYLKSMANREKSVITRKLRPITADIFSQVVDPQSEGYEQDSFVANDSEVEFDSRLDTLDLLEGHQNLTELRAQADRKGRKRIASAMHSSSDEESLIKSPVAKKRAESSSRQ